MNQKKIKKELRKELLQSRVDLEQQSYSLLSEQLVQHLSSWVQTQKCRNIFFYWPHRNEPYLTPLTRILGSSYQFFLPVIKKKKQMDFYLWKEGDSLRQNIYGISEPVIEEKEAKDPDDSTIVLVPCVGLDIKGNRLGTGAGYYDRFFNRFPSLCKVGVVFSKQFVKEIPAEEKDVRVNYIITENGLIYG